MKNVVSKPYLLKHNWRSNNMYRTIPVLVTTILILFPPSTRDIINAKEKNKGNTSSYTGKATKTFVAYYFHGNFRCDNCRKIEQYSREAIDKYFVEELKTKKLTFTIINTDLSENKHFIEDYQLYTRSLVIAEYKDGKQVRWKNLAKVWDYLNDKGAFYEYVRSEIRNYLEQV
jgi:hypothetical protein